jgi:hypothetical protein
MELSMQRCFRGLKGNASTWGCTKTNIDKIPEKEATMLWLAFVIFLVLWILGLIGTIAVGAWTWLFLVLCIIALITQVTAGRRTTPAVRP